MTQILRKLHFIIYLSLFFFISAEEEIQVEIKTITLASDPWMPFFGDVNSDKPGYTVELARAIFKDYDLKIITKPWSRTVQSTRTGLIDGAISADHDNNPDFIFPKESIGIQQFELWSLKELNWKFTGKSSLEEITLGSSHGYSYNDIIDKHIEKGENVNPLTGSGLPSRLIKMLLAKRHDVIIIESSVAKYTFSQLKLKQEDFKKIHSFPPSAPLHIGFSPKNSQQSEILAKIVDQKIKELRKSGELKKILARYGLSDWKKERD